MLHAKQAQRGSRGATVPVLDLGTRGDWWVGGQMPCPGHFGPVKEAWYSLYRGLCGPWCQSRWVWKIMPSPRFKFQTVQ